MDLKNYMVGNDENTINQINEIANSPAFKNQKIRIMPDAHSGKGCVVGTTSTYSDMICPNTVGVDIYCSVSAFEVPFDIDYEKLDKVVNENMPAGKNIHNRARTTYDYTQFRCYEDALKGKADYFDRSIGTLGSGNHYISIEVDKKRQQAYLVIHCGSRNLGVHVAEYYQEKAVEQRNSAIDSINSIYDKLIKARRSEGNVSGIQELIDHRNELIANNKVDKDLCYLTGSIMNDYIHDMNLCRNWVFLNHSIIYREIAEGMGWSLEPHGFHCSHNYVDTKNKIIRKGAISARKGEVGIVPLNMRDGSLIVIGKGNEDWNCSAPHGAGRIMSRSQARKTVMLDDYKKEMEGIYTTSVCEGTLDEAPEVYKSASAIIEAIKPTVDVYAHLVPRYNFKARS